MRPLVLASRGAASLILVPVWWASLGQLLWQAHAPAANTATAVGYAARA